MIELVSVEKRVSPMLRTSRDHIRFLVKETRYWLAEAPLDAVAKLALYNVRLQLKGAWGLYRALMKIEGGE